MREARSETATALAEQEKPGTAAPPKDLTPIGELKRGMSTVIRGKVTRILDEDEFRMEDANGDQA